MAATKKTTAKKTTAKKPVAKKTTSTVKKAPVKKTTEVKTEAPSIYNTNVSILLAMAIESLILLLAYLIIMSHV